MICIELESDKNQGKGVDVARWKSPLTGSPVSVVCT